MWLNLTFWECSLEQPSGCSKQVQSGWWPAGQISPCHATPSLLSFPQRKEGKALCLIFMFSPVITTISVLLWIETEFPVSSTSPWVCQAWPTLSIGGILELSSTPVWGEHKWHLPPFTALLQLRRWAQPLALAHNFTAQLHDDSREYD